MRFLALDIGNVRIGVASCDSLETAAYPLRTVTRVGSLKRDVAAVASTIVDEAAEAVVAGLPLSLDGTIGPQAELTLGFVRALRRAVSVPVVTWDESLTSVEAEEILIERGVSRQKRKAMIDQVAAVLILETYLRHRRISNSGLTELTPSREPDR